MSWYDVYDNVEVQRVTRARAAVVTGAVVGVLLASGAVLAAGLDGHIPTWLGVSLAVATWIGYVVWVVRRRRHLRRVVWCIKLSSDEVVGYDYSRRRITIPWTNVERIEVGRDGLSVYGPDSESIEIAHLFPDFAQVSHRVMHYGDRYGIPVFVNGKPWEQIDVYDVFPFLSPGDASSTQRGSTAV